jgi:hypothetical protein
VCEANQQTESIIMEAPMHDVQHIYHTSHVVSTHQAQSTIGIIEIPLGMIRMNSHPIVTLFSKSLPWMLQ